MAEAKTVNVAAAIFYKDNKILAACRADADNAGFWEFPGGKVEAGETSEQALRREIQEELHCSVQGAFFYDTVAYSYPTFDLHMDCYICTLGESEKPVADPEIHSELRWLAQTSCSTCSGFLRTLSSSSSLARSGTTSLRRSTCRSCGRVNRGRERCGCKRAAGANKSSCTKYFARMWSDKKKGFLAMKSLGDDGYHQSVSV